MEQTSIDLGLLLALLLDGEPTIPIHLVTLFLLLV